MGGRLWLFPVSLAPLGTYPDTPGPYPHGGKVTRWNPVIPSQIFAEKYPDPLSPP